jgi:hypothetical protein
MENQSKLTESGKLFIGIIIGIILTLIIKGC